MVKSAKGKKMVPEYPPEAASHQTGASGPFIMYQNQQTECEQYPAEEIFLDRDQSNPRYRVGS